MVGVYKITNPNGRVYIGSSIDIERRMNQYKRIQENQRQRKLYNSLIKYGFENHKVEILCECDVSEIYELERYYGDLYDSTSPKNLNCVLPKSSDKPVKISDETKKRLSESRLGEKHWNFGKTRSKEIKDKISIAHKGKKHSDEHRQKVSDNSASARIVIDLNTGIFYNSVTDLHKYYNKVSRSYLMSMINGHRRNKTSFIYA